MTKPNDGEPTAAWDPAISPVGWYVGAYQLRFIELDDGGPDDPNGQFLLWTNTVIVKASSLDEAHRKVTHIAQQSERPYLGGAEGVPVRWVFEGITELLPIYEALGDGAEIMWEEETGVSLARIRERALTLEDIKGNLRPPPRDP